MENKIEDIHNKFIQSWHTGVPVKELCKVLLYAVVAPFKLLPHVCATNQKTL